MERKQIMKFTLPKWTLLSRLSAREKKIVGLGAAAALLFFVTHSYLLPAYDAVRQYSDQIPQRTKLLRKYREVLAQRQAREQSLETLRKQLGELETRLLTARTLAAAQAQLQSLINDLGKQSQLQINRSDFLPKKELSKDYEKVSVRVDAMGTINQISAFLAATKSLPVDVFNDELRVVNYNGLSEQFKKNKQIAATLVMSAVIRHE